MLKLGCILSTITAALLFLSIFKPLDSLHGGIISLVLVAAAVVTTYIDYTVEDMGPVSYGPVAIVIAIFYSPLQLVDFTTKMWQFLDLGAGLYFLVEAIRLIVLIKDKSKE